MCVCVYICMRACMCVGTSLYMCVRAYLSEQLCVCGRQQRHVLQVAEVGVVALLPAAHHVQALLQLELGMGGGGDVCV